MIEIHLQPEAVADAEDAAIWYESQQRGLGTGFLLELDAAYQKIAQNPAMYAIQYRQARRILVRRFPYAIYFLYGDSVIEVFAVLHQHQESSAWQARFD